VGSPAVDRTPWALAAGVFVLHLAVAWRYDFFRDELYFIVCGRHPALGYVDQPPLVPLLAAATQLFGQSLFALRGLAAFAAAATVWVTCRIASLAGAGRFGVFLGGLAAGIAPMYLGLTSTFTTSTCGPLAWALVTYFVARVVIAGNAPSWKWAGVVAGIALEMKYDLPLFILPLLAALLATPARTAFRHRSFVVGCGLALLIALPSAVWQLSHGLPFLELVRAGASGKNVVLAPGHFLVNQLLVMNLLLAPLWLSGVVAPFVDRQFAPWRFASLAFVLVFALILMLRAKDYYLAPAYAPMFALGAAAVERWIASTVVRALWVAGALGLSTIAAPMAMPILDPPVLVRYLHRLGLQAQPTETAEQSEIPQTFADQLGWRRFVESVARVVRALPPEDQGRTAILTSNYGEAAALDFYGSALGLPPALSGHNSYWLWGPRGYDGSVLLRVNSSLERYRRLCQTAEIVGRFGAPYVMPFENDAPIILCSGLKVPLPAMWEEFKHFE
jgi:4-amino-4-deoxy-L-arabinose transferase-like glycosyltransferase